MTILSVQAYQLMYNFWREMFDKWDTEIVAYCVEHD